MTGQLCHAKAAAVSVTVDPFPFPSKDPRRTAAPPGPLRCSKQGLFTPRIGSCARSQPVWRRHLHCPASGLSRQTTRLHEMSGQRASTRPRIHRDGPWFRTPPLFDAGRVAPATVRAKRGRRSWPNILSFAGGSARPGAVRVRIRGPLPKGQRPLVFVLVRETPGGGMQLTLDRIDNGFDTALEAIVGGGQHLVLKAPEGLEAGIDESFCVARVCEPPWSTPHINGRAAAPGASCQGWLSGYHDATCAARQPRTHREW